MPTKATTKSKKIVNLQRFYSQPSIPDFPCFSNLLKSETKRLQRHKTLLTSYCSYATDELPDMLDKDLQLEFKKVWSSIL